MPTRTYEVSIAVEVSADSPEAAALLAEDQFQSAGPDGYRFVCDVKDLETGETVTIDPDDIDPDEVSHD